MSTKGQRKLRRIAEQRGLKFALERSVLNAARALMGAALKRGRASISDTTWDRFTHAATALHEYHAKLRRSASTTVPRKQSSGDMDR